MTDALNPPEVLRRLADDQVRTAQADVVASLRRLADAATEAANELSLAGPMDTITSRVPGAYDSVREAIVVLNAVRRGSARLRREAHLMGEEQACG